MRKSSTANSVRDALKALSAENPNIGFFQVWHSTAKVAERAGVSVTTARRYLEGLRGYRGYYSCRIGGTNVYRYVGDR